MHVTLLYSLTDCTPCIPCMMFVLFYQLIWDDFAIYIFKYRVFFFFFFFFFFGGGEGGGPGLFNGCPFLLMLTLNACMIILCFVCKIVIIIYGHIKKTYNLCAFRLLLMFKYVFIECFFVGVVHILI